MTPKTGFNLTYRIDLDECLHNKHDCDHICNNIIDGYSCDCFDGYELGNDGKTCIKSCGGIIDVKTNDKSQILTSPDYPNDYRNFENCRWQLKAPPNYNVFINFTDFDLEDNFKCHSDSLIIKSKLDDGSIFQHGKYCGLKSPNSLISQSNVLIIDFKSKFEFFDKFFKILIDFILLKLLN